MKKKSACLFIISVFVFCTFNSFAHGNDCTVDADSPQICKGECDSSGSITFSGITLYKNDWFYYDFSDDISLCDAVEYTVDGVYKVTGEKGSHRIAIFLLDDVTDGQLTITGQDIYVPSDYSDNYIYTSYGAKNDALTFTAVDSRIGRVITCKPEADFTFGMTGTVAPLKVQFTDYSKGIVDSWRWDFGDGHTSTLQNPSHTYEESGIYTVALTVFNSSGSDIVKQYIPVNDAKPTAGISIDPSNSSDDSFSPYTIALLDDSIGSITSWYWEFGDGSTSNAQNPTHTYSDSGDYTVTLKVTGPGGSDTEAYCCVNVLEPVTASANFSANPTSGRAPFLVAFTDESTGTISSWNWDFGDGATSTAHNPSHIYTSAGTYTVSLTVDGKGGTDTETKIGYITIERSTWYKDSDGDGYSDGTTQVAASQPTGYSLESDLDAITGDCDDSDATINPGVGDICGDGIDQNCDGADLVCGSTTTLSGKVTYNGEPLCALVLANEQHMFTCSGDGSFSLEVPFDSNGEIELYAFCNGMMAYQAILTGGQTDYEIEMAPANNDTKELIVTIDKMQYSDSKAGWVDLSGTVTDKDGVSLCAMVLANGQHTFTCGDNAGEFDLVVPIDANNQITLFVFCAGFKPYEKKLESSVIEVRCTDFDGDLYASK